MSKHLSSFRSYYNAFGQNGHKKDAPNGHHLEEVETQPDVEILPQLLPGEVIIARAEGVHVFQPLSTNNQGQIGQVYVTNFRISFQTITFPDYRREHYADLQDFWHPWSRGMIDIPLASISGLFRLAKNGRRKAFKIGPLKKILLVCKNFRMETFSFLQSSSVDSHGVASALAGYVFPVEKERLFVYNQDGLQKGKESSGRKMEHVLFSVRNDWIMELSRLGCRMDDWRITQANEDFHLSQNLPRCFVVPAAMGDDNELETMCLQLSTADDRRPCLWSWSSPSNGAALCRMSGDLVDQPMKTAVLQAHPRKSAPIILDVGAFCPTVKEVKKSYDMWRDSFLVESTAALEASDDKWFLDVETSRWLQNISRCLEVAKMAVSAINDGFSVIFRESGDRDLNCVVSSLSQLCLDPSCRTVAGFQRLVEKEFVAFGHRFQERLGLVKADPLDVEAPVFLLFLDCVYQLTVQYPASFDLTAVYLISLLDSALMGAFRNFSMNCQRDVLGSRKGATSSHYASVWQLDLSAKGHLTNRLYQSFDQLNASSAPSPQDPTLQVLIPNPAIPFLSIWKQCYFRFIPPLAVRSTIGQKMEQFIYRTCYEIESICREIGIGNAAMAVIREEDGVSVDGDDIIDGTLRDAAGRGRGDTGADLRGGTLLRRRSQLLRPFTPQNASSSHSLMTFQKQ